MTPSSRADFTRRSAINAKWHVANVITVEVSEKRKFATGQSIWRSVWGDRRGLSWLCIDLHSVKLHTHVLIQQSVLNSGRGVIGYF